MGRRRQSILYSTSQSRLANGFRLAGQLADRCGPAIPTVPRCLPQLPQLHIRLPCHRPWLTRRANAAPPACPPAAAPAAGCRHASAAAPAAAGYPAVHRRVMRQHSQAAAMCRTCEVVHRHQSMHLVNNQPILHQPAKMTVAACWGSPKLLHRRAVPAACAGSPAAGRLPATCAETLPREPAQTPE